MLIAEGKYLDDLRNEVVHLRSKNKIYTDAPIDNNGKGEQFSPTDLLAVSLATCMVTIMGIWANQHNKTLGDITYTIKKEMNPSPRKVNRIAIDFKLKNDLSDKEKNLLESAAKKCPVALSLSKDLMQEIKFTYV